MKTSRSTARLVLLAVLAAAMSGPVLAWNSAGHRLAAAIAWQHMTPPARSEAARLLRLHPDHSRWLKRAGEGDGDRLAFIESSTWPDDIRQDSRFYSADTDAPTPTLPGFPDMERRRAWHYVNIPLNGGPDAKPLSGQIDRRLPELEQTLNTHNDAERVYALPWFIHLVGDAHQPLHTSARADANGNWDKLGNALEVRNPFNPREPQSSLHAFWDDLPGPPWLRGERLDRAAQALIAAHPRPAPAPSSRQWIEEGWRLARNEGYPQNNEAIPTITEAFYARSRTIADERVALAGYRLADALNRAFARKADQR